MKRREEASGQDGGIGRYTLPPQTTKRTTTNSKTKNNQNCQKIKLYGSPTTKELKKKHSSRPVGRVDTGSRSIENSWQGSSWWTRHDSRLWTGQSHIHEQRNWVEQVGSKTDCTTQGSSAGK